MLSAIAYPQIDPILVHLGPVAIRWYALSYIAGILGAWWTVRQLARRPVGPAPILSGAQIEEFVSWATVGVILGGRLGYVLFYKPDYYLSEPLEILQVWKGGMSFHGGLLGVVLALVLFTRRQGIGLLAFGDLVACGVPVGLFFGRIANFVNGELFGRVAPDVPWAMVFPGGGPDPRHPSQLYEAALEGLLLYVVLHLLWRIKAVRGRAGMLSGAFLIGYGASRITVEFFRQPDPFLGFLWGGATMGQLLSLPLILVGLALVATAKRPS
ncbi:MAG: prolipoprotein diacylglyceryl transferase [Alphaproteobacteria bacterium]|nr:prolipoprotein diacylglyceryl transferase [Alphaproteobacteria bacterium]MBF0130093.1 prolipoprotein diacylglyceryl transferase [Alphaproteobacteria bacterium]